MKRQCMYVIAALLLASLGFIARAASEPDTQPGVVLVKLRTPPALLRHSFPAGVNVEAQIVPDVYRVRVPPGNEAQVIAALSARSDVVYAQRDHRVTAQVQPDDPRYGEQWNMAHIGMPHAWATITSTTNLTIAVLDTGVTTMHPDLNAQLWQNPGEVPGNGIDDDGNGYVDDLHGWHFYQSFSSGRAFPHEDAQIDDANGHGTHVVGVIAARGNNGIGVTGVVWRAHVMIVRVLDADAVGWESDIVRGLQYAIANGAQIINLSIGQSEASPALAEAVVQAEAHGVLVVAAAGNTGTVLYPAAYPTVLSVGASDQRDQPAAFSAHGPRLDLLAPGVDILSTWNGVPYFTRSGTSFAAPHVAGVAALLRAARPQMTLSQIRYCLTWTATDIGTPGRDDTSGWGVLNAARVLNGCARPLWLPLISR